MDNTRTQMSAEFEALKTRTYRLEVVEGPDKGLLIDASDRVTRLGTNPDCECELNDPTTSRIHARIEADVLGHRLIDEDSKNGTLVNELRAHDVYLNPGSLIRIGENVIRFSLGTEEVEIRLARSHKFGKTIGQSTAMREIFAVLERISPTDLTILIEGESGTGKELIADAVHTHSTRHNGPFVVFDCSAVAPTLVESELFGHVKGAFTGATTERAGAFERASGGTLFLDELGELPLDLQPKLLRALEQKKIRRVGGDHEITVDARIVAATNRNLKKEVEVGQFRQDLFYRIAVIRIVLPPLRRRRDDVPMLVQHFLNELVENGAPEVQVGYDTILKLQNHAWPGNVRELRNFVERAALLATGDRLETRHLVPPSFGDTQTHSTTGGDAASAALSDIDVSLPFKDAKARLIDTFERAYWTRLLEKTGGNVSAAARTAGIHRKSAEYLLKKLDLRSSD
jgi:transcriptional regulator with GAF, ATPase, and Fis domain